MPSRICGYTPIFLLTMGLADAQVRPAQIVILIGPPGSGKSVQANLLSKSRKVPAISMASLLKQGPMKKNPGSKSLASSVASGELVGDEAANEVIKTRLLQPDAGRGFILDGYPTTVDQAKVLDAFLSEHGFPKPLVVVLQAPDNVLRERMKSRRRVDDSPENIERRLKEYRELEASMQKRYGSLNAILVDGTRSVEQVAAAIADQIDNVRSSKGLITRPPQTDGLKQRPAETSPPPQ